MKSSNNKKACEIIKNLIWIDAKVNNKENNKYKEDLKNKYNLLIESYDTAEKGIEALEKIKFKSIFLITSGTIYPEVFNYMKRELDCLRVIPFSIIFTSSKKKFIENHKKDEIGKIYNKTFFNRGGVVDNINGVFLFIDEIYNNLKSFKTNNKYKGIYTKNYSGLTVFEKFNDSVRFPDFYKDINNNKHIDFSELNQFTIFFLKNFCTSRIENLLKPLILFKEVPEVIISKYWARIYTYESHFYSVMNKNLMKNVYYEYKIYIKLLYRGLACDSYQTIFDYSKCSEESYTLTRGTKLELSEINYLKSIAGKNIIIYNKSFLSFTISVNEKLAIDFQENEERIEGEPEEEKEVIKKVKEIKEDSSTEIPICQKISEKEIEKEIKKNSLNVLIKLNINDDDDDIDYYVKSNAYLKNISCYSKEEEVLIFPFTGFEVIDWETRYFEKEKYIEEGTVFYFSFSKKYFEQIKKIYKT